MTDIDIALFVSYSMGAFAMGFVFGFAVVVLKKGIDQVL